MNCSSYRFKISASARICTSRSGSVDAHPRSSEPLLSQGFTRRPSPNAVLSSKYATQNRFHEIRAVDATLRLVEHALGRRNRKKKPSRPP
jgi:hypothetical protein